MKIPQEFSVDFRLLPYPIRRRFYELSTPVEVYLLRQTSKEIFNDLKFIKTYVDSLNVGEVYHTKLKVINSILELEVREDALPEFINVRKEVVFLCSPKFDLVEAHSRITGSFNRFILKGKPSFQQFQETMKDGRFQSLDYFAFCGEFRGQFSLPNFLDSISSIPNINVIMYWNLKETIPFVSEIRSWEKKREIQLDSFKLHLIYPNKRAPSMNNFFCAELDGEGIKFSEIS